MRGVWLGELKGNDLVGDLMGFRFMMSFLPL